MDTFEEYREHHQSTIRNNILVFLWSCIIICFVAELVIFFFSKPYITWSIKDYVLTKIVYPTILDFAVTILATILNYHKKIPSDFKTYTVLLSISIVCTVIATSHAYFSHIMFILAFPLFLCVLFDRKRILTVISICMILPMVLTCWEFWKASYELTDFTKTMDLLVYVIIMVICFYLSDFLLRVHKSQTDYIFDDYLRQNQLEGKLKFEPMTKLFNKSYMEECLDAAVSNKNGTKYVIAIIDIDHFKVVNDTYGHKIGDLVLLNLSGTIKKMFTYDAKAFRYGGEEFLILFQNKSSETVNEEIMNLKTTFIKKNKSVIKDKDITFSCGICELKENMDKNVWFNNADTTLYKCKNEGRNKVLISE